MCLHSSRPRSSPKQVDELDLVMQRPLYWSVCLVALLVGGRMPPSEAAVASPSLVASPAAAQELGEAFKVQPPFLSKTVFPLIEEARISVVKLLLGARSETITTTVGKTHLLSCPGSGPYPTAVLVHGVCSCAHDYFPLIWKLRKLCKSVLVIDLPGHGRSEIPDGELEDSWLTDSLCESLDVLVPKGEKVLLFGNSLGGLVAIKAALLCPDKFVGLILASPAGAPVTPAELQDLKGFFKLDKHQDGVAFMSRVAARPERFPTPLMHVMAWACRARVSSPTIHRIMTKASSTHMLSGRQLARLKVPTYFIWGKYERIFTANALQFFRKNLPKDVEINESEDFGHVPFLDDVGRLTELLHNFMMRTCPPPPPAGAS